MADSKEAGQLGGHGVRVKHVWRVVVDARLLSTSSVRSPTRLQTESGRAVSLLLVTRNILSLASLPMHSGRCVITFELTLRYL